jgi:peptidoglycan/xylan/chitin deacetylase (PgdA/CDA1 family)
MNHIFLNSLSPSEISEEFIQSKSLIEKKIGKKCRNICYPAGIVTASVIKQAIDSGYESGFTTRPVNNSLRTNIYLLNRKDAGYFFVNNKLKRSYFFFVLSSFHDLLEIFRYCETIVRKLYYTFVKMKNRIII